MSKVIDYLILRALLPVRGLTRRRDYSTLDGAVYSVFTQKVFHTPTLSRTNFFVSYSPLDNFYTNTGIQTYKPPRPWAGYTHTRFLKTPNGAKDAPPPTPTSPPQKRSNTRETRLYYCSNGRNVIHHQCSVHQCVHQCSVHQCVHHQCSVHQCVHQCSSNHQFIHHQCSNAGACLVVATAHVVGLRVSKLTR